MACSGVLLPGAGGTGLTGGPLKGRRTRVTSTVTVLAIALLLAMLVIDRLAR